MLTWATHAATFGFLVYLAITAEGIANGPLWVGIGGWFLGVFSAGVEATLKDEKKRKERERLEAARWAGLMKPWVGEDEFAPDAPKS